MIVVVPREANKQRSELRSDVADLQKFSLCQSAAEFWRIQLLENSMGDRSLEPHAADAVGAHHIDFVVNKIDARHVADCLLNELF